MQNFRLNVLGEWTVDHRILIHPGNPGTGPVTAYDLSDISCEDKSGIVRCAFTRELITTLEGDFDFPTTFSGLSATVAAMWYVFFEVSFVGSR